MNKFLQGFILNLANNGKVQIDQERGIIDCRAFVKEMTEKRLKELKKNAEKDS